MSAGSGEGQGGRGSGAQGQEGRRRADLGFADALAGFDPGEWGRAPPPRPAPEIARTAAEAAGFARRDPRAPDPVPAAGAPEPAPLPRRRRTGRNVQFNIKARPETIRAFCAIADARGWGLGETLEEAVRLLEAAHPPTVPTRHGASAENNL